jgi:serine/threonine-protein kinase
LNVQAPRPFDAVIRKAMAKRPEDRYATAAEFKQAIRQAMLGSGQTLPESTLVNPAADAAATVVRQGGSATVAAPQAVATPASTAAKPGGLPLPLLAAGLAALVIGAAWLFDVGGLKTRLGGASGAPPAAAASGAPAIAAPAGPDAAGSPASLAPADPSAASAAAPATVPAFAGAPRGGIMTITALGVADPKDPRFAGDPAAAGRQAIEDARRQLIEKAAALYVEPRSLVQNYPVVRDRLLTRSDAFIRTVLDEPPATLAKNGLVTASLRATVDVREVQKWLNQMSREERVQLIRNNGDPRIAVSIRVQRAGGEGAEPSEVAENVVKARIRSFGFSVFDPAVAKDSIDFNVEGTAALKKLSARLPSSGLTVEKFALTSFTTRAVDARSGQEVYTSTEIPKGRSWASEELALEEIGKLVGEQFSRTFFLENFEFASRRARLQFQGLPEGIAPALLSELQAVVPVLNAVIVDGGGMDVVLDLELSGGTMDPAELVQGSILRPLNRKLGRSCFSVAPAAAGALKVAFAAECRAPQIVSRLESRPPAALLDAASQRLDAIGSSGGLLQRVTTT